MSCPHGCLPPEGWASCGHPLWKSKAVCELTDSEFAEYSKEKERNKLLRKVENDMKIGKPKSGVAVPVREFKGNPSPFTDVFLLFQDLTEGGDAIEVQITPDAKTDLNTDGTPKTAEEMLAAARGAVGRFARSRGCGAKTWGSVSTDGKSFTLGLQKVAERPAQPRKAKAEVQEPVPA